MSEQNKVKVRAVRPCYVNGKRHKVGESFSVSPEHFSYQAMEIVEGDMPKSKNGMEPKYYKPVKKSAPAEKAEQKAESKKEEPKALFSSQKDEHGKKGK